MHTGISVAISALMLATALGFFAKTMYSMVRAAARGGADIRPRLDQIPARVASVVIYFFGQKKVAQEGPLHQTSKHHLLIFYGFLVITIGTVDLLVSSIVAPLALENLLPGLLYAPLVLGIDMMNLLVLTVICWALFRRIVLKPSLIPMNLDAGLILGAIACLMLTHFLTHGFEAAAAITTGAEIHAGPVSAAVGHALAPVSPEAAEIGYQWAYWVHFAIVLIFLNYLPYSKHIHLLGALPNIFTRNLSERKLDMPKLDLEDENQWGVGRIEQFSWKSLIDNYACTECARCSNYCPAYNTGKNLSPMQLVHDLRYEMLDRDEARVAIDDLTAQKAALEKAVGDDEHSDKKDKLDAVTTSLKAAQKRYDDMEELVGGRVQESTLWSCTTCGACQEVCPVFIEHPLKIIQMRQNLVLEQEKTPGELARAFRNIERQSNPWGIGNDKRMDWAKDLDVPTIEDTPNPEYLLWVGCAGAFDQRIQKQTVSMIQILNAAKVDYAVLGHREGCTGDPARRAGNEMLFQMQAEANVEELNDAGVKKVVTSCPHCLHTLRHDYPQFGGEYEVVHHTQLIDALMKDGKLVPGTEKNGVSKVTFHDSCYLGRWNNEYDAPREVLNRLPIADGVVEMARNKRHGFCCGAGGGRMFMEEHGERVNQNRTKEAIDTGADTVAVACPFCNVMMTDGTKELGVEDQVQVLDVAELVARSLPSAVSAEPPAAEPAPEAPPEATADETPEASA